MYLASKFSNHLLNQFFTKINYLIEIKQVHTEISLRTQNHRLDLLFTESVPKGTLSIHLQTKSQIRTTC